MGWLHSSRSGCSIRRRIMPSYSSSYLRCRPASGRCLTPDIPASKRSPSRGSVRRILLTSSIVCRYCCAKFRFASCLSTTFLWASVARLRIACSSSDRGTDIARPEPVGTTGRRASGRVAREGSIPKAPTRSTPRTHTRTHAALHTHKCSVPGLFHHLR